MKKALVVGINYYQHVGNLKGCVNDARAVDAVLAHHMDGQRNFDTKLVTATDVSTAVSRKQLKEDIIALFAANNEVALLYFAGHGHVEAAGGYLVTSDCKDGDDGLPLEEIMSYANDSKATNKILILDSCYSGRAGTPTSLGEKALLSEGVTILTASSKDQYALEAHGSGVFTALLVDALQGGAANLVGDITPGSVYAHIDQSLGAWEQRPIFKTNVRTFTSLRKVTPPIQLSDLKQITALFQTPDSELLLDPSFEPQPPAPNHGVLPDPENNRKFAILQKLNRLNLVKPVSEIHMYFAAMNSSPCRLTVLGEHYWSLIDKGRI
jgi:hypothetical protein